MMKMKTLAALFATCALASSAAFAANTGNIDFSGTVLSGTCDLKPSLTTVALGTDVVANKLGAVIPFQFDNDPTSASGCATTTAATIAIAWSGSDFNTNGLAAATGSVASDSLILIKPVNSTAPGTIVSTTAPKTIFNLAELAKGLQFSAQLQAGAIPGAFTAQATYTVSYI